MPTHQNRCMGHPAPGTRRVRPGIRLVYRNREGDNLNLQTHITSELWESLASAYDSGNYSHAVLEAMHHLTTVLRERSGAEGDGVALVGQALGGDAPKLLINGFQSETDRNVQRGIEQVLRGIYLSIRNPRSHEQMTDTQQDADAIIHFIDYILRILTSSKEAFTVESFMASISDIEFVESKRYAELLVAEVPTNRRGDALVALFKSRRTKEIRKLRYVVSTLLAVLSETQLVLYLEALSLMNCALLLRQGIFGPLYR
jgi:uncharacterized protein (TIGR02391 family)